jgi:hypothetical protein
VWDTPGTNLIKQAGDLMAKQGTSMLEGQLVSARERAEFSYAEGGSFETSARLLALKSALKSLKNSSDVELFRYFPVAVIAVLESHFKLAVKAIVDNGSPYLERGLVLVKERLRVATDVVPILHRKTVSVGELVAHQLPFNSLASFEDPLSSLLDQSFKNLIRTVRDPWMVRIDSDSPPIVKDLEKLWRTLARTFEQRHIVAHEAASKFTVTYEDAKDSLECAEIFTNAVDASLWATIWLNVPLNQREMNVNAWDIYRETRRNFAGTLRAAYVIAKERSENKSFYQLHKIWKQYARGWADLEEEGWGSGSIRPLIAATVRNSLLEARLKSVIDWISMKKS